MIKKALPLRERIAIIGHKEDLSSLVSEMAMPKQDVYHVVVPPLSVKSCQSATTELEFEIEQMFREVIQIDVKDIISAGNSRKANVVPTTGTESDSPRRGKPASLAKTVIGAKVGLRSGRVHPNQIPMSKM